MCSLNMQNKLERLIKMVYKKYKSDHLQTHRSHPDDESMACFLEGRLSQEENEQIKLHLISCDRCAQAFVIQIRLNSTLQAKGGMSVVEGITLPLELIERIKNLIIEEEKTAVLEILLVIKERALELLNTTGDVIVGQELMPASVLRSRQIKDFKDEVNILKDFQDIRVEIKIENKHGQSFALTILVKEKQTSRIIKDLRVTLLKDDLELESYLTDRGSVTFGHVLIGKYKVQISTVEKKVASILLDIRT